MPSCAPSTRPTTRRSAWWRPPSRGRAGPATPGPPRAAGVFLVSEPRVTFLPLQRPARGDDTSIPTTQYAMEAVADIGLLKMDFLGLANLTILGKAVEFIRETQGGGI